MNKAFVIASFLALLSTGTLLATEYGQTVTVNGSTVAKEVTALAFSGDNVTLTFADATTQTADMESVTIAFTYGTTGISSIDTDKVAETKKGVYTIDGRRVGDTTAGLTKGLYIVDGKKVIIK